MTELETNAYIWAEGFEPLPYKDPKGIWTCGIGHNLEAHGIPADWVRPILSRTGISQKQATAMLMKDVEDARELTIGVFTDIQWSAFSEPQRFVITDMIFNMGLGSEKPAKGFLSFNVATIPAIKRGDWKQVCSNLRRSKWVRDTGRRALRDISILETDKVRVAL